MKKLSTILLVALVHCLLSGFLLISSFHFSLDADAPPLSLYQQVAAPLSKILLLPAFLPLAEFAPKAFPGLLGYIPMYLNSLIWAIAIVFIRDKFTEKKLLDKQSAT